MNYYIYLPLILNLNEKITSYLYLKFDSNLRKTLTYLLNIDNETAICDIQNKDISECRADAIQSGTVVFVGFRNTNRSDCFDIENLQDLNARYIEPDQICEPNFVNDYDKFSIKDILSSHLSEVIIDFTIYDNSLLFLQKYSNGYKILKTKFTFNSSESLICLDHDITFKGLFIFNDKIHLFDNTNIYSVDMSTSQTLEMQYTCDYTIERVIPYFDNLIIKSNSVNGFNFECINTSYRNIDLKNIGSKYMSFFKCDFGNFHIILQQYSVEANFYPYISSLSAPFLIVDNFIYLCNANCEPVVSLEIVGGKKIEVINRIIFILSENSIIHRILINKNFKIAK